MEQFAKERPRLFTLTTINIIKIQTSCIIMNKQHKLKSRKLTFEYDHVFRNEHILYMLQTFDSEPF